MRILSWRCKVLRGEFHPGVHVDATLSRKKHLQLQTKWLSKWQKKYAAQDQEDHLGWAKGTRQRSQGIDLASLDPWTEQRGHDSAHCSVQPSRRLWESDDHMTLPSMCRHRLSVELCARWLDFTVTIKVSWFSGCICAAVQQSGKRCNLSDTQVRVFRRTARQQSWLMQEQSRA